MRIIVVGLGSMGRRRIGLLKELGKEDIVGIDTNEERRLNAEKEFNIKTSGSLDNLLKGGGCDCAFICTSPLSHGKIINSCLMAGLHVFTEINLVEDQYEDNIRIASEKGLVLFLSSTFLYRNEINWLIDKVHAATMPFNYIYHVGQYLPDWHPWENYNNFFVANERTNACREIFAIELPWIITCFGDIVEVNCLKDKMTKLDLSFPDNYLVQVVHKNGTKGLLAVDVVSRKSIRRLELFNENEYLIWNGGDSSVQEYNIDKKEDERLDFGSRHDDRYASFINESPYLEEIKSFFASINKMEEPKWSFEKDLHMLHLINRLEGKE